MRCNLHILKWNHFKYIVWRVLINVYTHQQSLQSRYKAFYYPQNLTFKSVLNLATHTRHTLMCFLSVEIELPLLEFYVNGIMQYVALWVNKHLTLGIMFLKFIHASCTSNFFLLTAERMDLTQFAYPFNG